MRRLAWLTTVVLATATGVLVVWQFRNAAALFLLSLAVAATVRPIVERQVSRGVPRWLALFLTYGLGLAALVSLAVAVSDPLLREAQHMAEALVERYEAVLAGWQDGNDFQQAAAGWLPPVSELYAALGGAQGRAMAANLLGVTVGVFDVLGQALSVLVLSVYWGADQSRFERLWLSALPVEQRAGARETWRAIEAGVGAYLRSELAAVYTLVILMLLEFVLEPRLYNRRRFSSLLVVLVFLALSPAYGLLGLVVAPPLAAALQLLGGRLARQVAPVAPPAPLAERMLTLDQRLETVRTALAAATGPVPPHMVSMLDRLERLIATAAPAVQEEAAGPERAG